MKKKYIIAIVIVLIIGGFSFLIYKKYEEKHKYDSIKYGRAEYVTSMSEIDKSLPTIILFKSVMAEHSFDAEKNLKLLHDKYGDQFNIVHASADSLDNDEAVSLAKKYDVTGVPTFVALDKNGNLIEKKEDIYSEKAINNILKDMGIKM
ncbi:hypothetical protein [Clostridium sp. Ade.TY]|uniref:TlpA family protein disulfide reductase n=1 Tax=Clostridium sp. Ade.TY TaxID=1391647 RepID=UPI00041784C3|nr:hypothetical protein [Clostridium sp. Ade.TY]